jgi:hypothetical protein
MRCAGLGRAGWVAGERRWAAGRGQWQRWRGWCHREGDAGWKEEERRWTGGGLQPRGPLSLGVTVALCSRGAELFVEVRSQVAPLCNPQPRVARGSRGRTPRQPPKSLMLCRCACVLLSPSVLPSCPLALRLLARPAQFEGTWLSPSHVSSEDNSKTHSQSQNLNKTPRVLPDYQSEMLF